MLRIPPSPNSARNSSPAGTSNRTFGLVFAGFFLLIGVAPLPGGGSLRLWAVAVAVGFGIGALGFPALLARPNRWWRKFGELLHRITSPVALALIYVVGVVPPGLLMQMLGKDPLRLKRVPAASSYWIPRVPPGRAGAGMKNQF